LFLIRSNLDNSPLSELWIIWMCMEWQLSGLGPPVFFIASINITKCDPALWTTPGEILFSFSWAYALYENGLVLLLQNQRVEHMPYMRMDLFSSYKTREREGVGGGEGELWNVNILSCSAGDFWHLFNFLNFVSFSTRFLSWLICWRGKLCMNCLNTISCPFLPSPPLI
jgi:hypothetical protein